MKRLFLIFAMLLMVVSLSSCVKERYKVKTPEEFIEAVRENSNALITVKRDLDFEGIEWKPMAFGGSIYGKGHTFKNISIISTSGDNIGMFTSGDVSVSDLTIENLVIEHYGDGYNIGGIVGQGYGIYISNVKVSGSLISYMGEHVGGIAGSIDDSYGSTLKNVTVDMDVKGVRYVGGAVGRVRHEYRDATFTNVVNHGNVTSVDNGAGGIVGGVDKTAQFYNCVNNGNITGKGFVAGIAGYGVVSAIENCSNYGDVSSFAKSEAAYAGGIFGAGNITKNIKQCENSGNIQGISYGVGGIAGAICEDTKILGSENYGEVKSDSHDVAGIAGSAEDKSQLIQCVNQGVVVGKTKAGGIVGNATEDVFVSFCNNSGSITANDETGGIAGYTSSSGNLIVSNCDNSGSVTAEGGMAAGIVGYAYNKHPEDIDTNKNTGELSGVVVNDIFNDESDKEGLN